MIGRVCWLVRSNSITFDHWSEVGQVNLSRSRHRSGVFGFRIELIRTAALFFRP